MKLNYLGKVASLLLGAAFLVCPSNAQAGWGILGGSNGGSSGGSSGFASSGGSSGGYAASYGGSSGYAASYGSYGSTGAGSSGGSSGYAASYSSYGGGSSGGSSGRPGLLQRFASRIHDHAAAKRARHAARRSNYGSSGYGSSGGSSGYVASYASYGGGSSGGGSSGGYPAYSNYSGGSSGGSVNYGSTGYRSGVSYGSTGYEAGYGSSEVYYGASNDTGDSNADSLVSDFNSVTNDDAVYLTLAVPSNAKVFVNDNETSSTGTVRKFVSRGLEAGKQYRFEVRAEIVDASGKLLTEEKSVVVSSGAQEQIQFAFAEQDSPIETAITLNLPEGAKVTLAGSETKAAGETRIFRTGRLKAGEIWDDYEIEVEHEGQVKRQSIRLVGGDKLQLTFDFDQPVTTVAAR